MAGIRIIGLGRSEGEKKVTNYDLAKLVDTSDEWVTGKTGIKSRYFAVTKSNGDMAFEAAENAISKAGIDKSRIGYCIVCTFTPDDATPAVACDVAGRLGLSEQVMALDLNGACSGFIFGCNISNGLLSLNRDKYALVIGSEKISPLMDMNDRGTCVLFGDGAGAAVVKYDESANFTFLGGCIPNREVLYCERFHPSIKMQGQEVYRFAVNKVVECINSIMNASGIVEKEVDYFVCHQANERIIDNVARRVSPVKEKFYKNLCTYGNTSAASIPIALCQMEEASMLKGKRRLVCTGFGAGLTYGTMTIEVENEN